MEQTSWRTPPQMAAESEIKETYTCDVLVIGASFAGTMAMEAAAKGGKKVIALEKKPKDKFNVFGQEVGHINSKFLESFQVPKVDPADLFNEWIKRAGARANQRLVMEYCKNCGRVFDDFISVFNEEEISELRVKYWPLPKYYTGSVNGYYAWPGTALFRGVQIPGKTSLTECIRRHHEKSISLGAQIFYGTEALYPVMEGNRIAAIDAKAQDGSLIRIHTENVVLASGGFGKNLEMCEELLPEIVDLLRDEDKINYLGDQDGIGVRIGVWAGGKVEPRTIPTMGGNLTFPASMFDGYGCLLLNCELERYCNEMFSGDSVIAGIGGNMEKIGPKYSLFDSTIEEHLQHGTPAHAAFDISDPANFEKLEEDMRKTREAGASGYEKASGLPGSVSYSADTWEELADMLGFDEKQKETFLKSIQRYNELCYAGKDEDFGKEAHMMIALDKPPYYVTRLYNLAPGLGFVTVGGMLTDHHQQVLDKNRDPIPGLFATGNCCGRRFGSVYSTPIAGVSIGMAITLGTTLGEYLTK